MGVRTPMLVHVCWNDHGSNVEIRRRISSNANMGKPLAEQWTTATYVGKGMCCTLIVWLTGLRLKLMGWDGHTEWVVKLSLDLAVRGISNDR